MVFFTDRDLGQKVFPGILEEAGMRVERHADHFPDSAPDTAWIPEVARRGWLALTHNKRIRYTPAEKSAVLISGLRVLVLVGKTTTAELARNIVNTRARVEAFAARHEAPYIAKVTRPSPVELVAQGVPGRVVLWLPASPIDTPLAADSSTS